MPRVIPDPSQALDHHRDPGQRPQIGGESVTRCSAPQCRIELCQLPRLHSGLPAGAARPFQPLAPAGLPGAIPSTGRHRRHVQRTRHRGLRLAAREQARGPKPPCFQRSEIPSGTTRSWHLATSHRTREYS